MAASIRLGTVIPGAGLIVKPVMSMRELHYENIVEQQTDFSCGAAALATILRHAYGREVTEEQVVTDMLKVADAEQVRQTGFSLLDVKRYLETIGMRGRGYRIAAEALPEVKVPSIVLLDYKGYKHFVVLQRTTATSVYLADPSLGNRVMDRQQFASSWNGIVFAVIGQNYDRSNPLLRPREPFTVRNNVNTFRPLTDVELIDFGFSRADYF